MEYAEARPRILGLAHVTGAAASAATVCAPLLLASRPRTPLRVCCVAAFEYLARLEGGTLGRRRRQTMARACDFGSLRDDYYDHRRLDMSEYRALRSALRHAAPESATRRYIRNLRTAERTRPTLVPGTPGGVEATIAYRTRVLELSLRWLQEISGLRVEDATCRALLGLVGLMQVVDDLLDWEDDLEGGRPSYVTAFLLDRPRGAVSGPIGAEADALLGRTVGPSREETGVVPFAVAGVLTWGLVLALLKVRFPR